MKKIINTFKKEYQKKLFGVASILILLGVIVVFGFGLLINFMVGIKPLYGLSTSYVSCILISSFLLCVVTLIYLLRIMSIYLQFYNKLFLLNMLQYKNSIVLYNGALYKLLDIEIKEDIFYGILCREVNSLLVTVPLKDVVIK